MGRPARKYREPPRENNEGRHHEQEARSPRARRRFGCRARRLRRWQRCSAPTRRRPARSPSGSSAPTRPTPRATTSRRRSRPRTRAGRSRSRRRPGPTRARPTSPRCRPTTRPTSSRSATRRRSVSSTRACSLDITDIQEDLGGDDLLPGLVDAGTYDDAFYAAPVLRRWPHRLLQPADRDGEPFPTTLDEYVAQGIAMTHRHRLGHLRAGQGLVQRPSLRVGARRRDRRPGRRRAGTRSSPATRAVAGLEQLQEVYLNATNAPADGDEANPQVPFCAGEVGLPLGSRLGEVVDPGPGRRREPRLPRHLRQGPRRVPAARA